MEVGRKRLHLSVSFDDESKKLSNGLASKTTSVLALLQSDKPSQQTHKLPPLIVWTKNWLNFYELLHEGGGVYQCSWITWTRRPKRNTKKERILVVIKKQFSKTPKFDCSIIWKDDDTSSFMDWVFTYLDTEDANPVILYNKNGPDPLLASCSKTLKTTAFWFGILQPFYNTEKWENSDMEHTLSLSRKQIFGHEYTDT